MIEILSSSLTYWKLPFLKDLLCVSLAVVALGTDPKVASAIFPFRKYVLSETGRGT